MKIETKTNLDESTLESIQDLIRINIDSARGFEEASEQIADDTLTTVFKKLAEERIQNAKQLEHYVTVNGEHTAVDGSYLAKFHRVWLEFRAKLNGGDAHVILSEAERGEDFIKLAYEETLKQTAGSAMNDVLTEQYANVKRGHDRIRDLRDSFAMSN